jgi:fatty acid desaturase
MSNRIPLFDVWWLAAVLRNWFVIVLTIAAAWELDRILVYALAVLVIGTRQHALVILQHDGTHYHVSRKKRLNNLAMDFLTAWPLGFSTSGYRRYHLAHHRWQGTAADPELSTYGRFAGKWSADANRYQLFISDLLGFGAAEVLVLWDDIMKSRDPKAKLQRYLEIAGMIAWPLGAGGLLTALVGWRLCACVAGLWYGSLLTSFFAAFRLRAYSEHIGSEGTHRWRQPALWRRLLYLPENTWLHWEHHAWPGIPLRKLKSLVGNVALESASPQIASADDHAAPAGHI